MKKVIYIMFAFMMIAMLLTGCGENDDTVQTCIIANTEYSEQNDVKSAIQPEKLAAGSTAYASIHFVESPKGLEYTVKWILDGTEIKSEKKAIENDTQNVLVYKLEANEVVAGSLEVQVLYKDTVLYTKEIPVE